MSYITIGDLREEGVANPPYKDAWLTDRIALATELFNGLTHRFFEERPAQTFILKGSGHDILWLPAPPVTTSSITEVKLNDVVQVEGTDYSLIMPTTPDGRFYPKLQHLLGKWVKKRLPNVIVTGVFGFVDRKMIQSVETSVTPVLVQDAIKRIVMMYLPTLTENELSQSLRIVQEQLKDYSYKLQDVKATGYFNDPFIDGVIAKYKKQLMRMV